MKQPIYKQWTRAYKYQQSLLESYDNSIITETSTGVENIDRLQYAIPNAGVLWMIMADGYYIDDYEEGATEYGVTLDGKWAAVYDGHCSCYGWEAGDENISFYDNLNQLLKCDKKSSIIIDQEDHLCKLYPFLEKYYDDWYGTYSAHH